jgi:uncharacterized phage-associated protein
MEASTLNRRGGRLENQKGKKMTCDITNTSNQLNDNSILMLSLVAESSKRGWLGITKLQKLSFLTEYYLSQQGKRAFGHRFFMHDHGPISKGVYRNLETLLNEDLVVDENGFQTSDLGHDLADQFKCNIPAEIRSVMDSVVKRFSSWSTYELVKFVHNMKVTLPNGENARIDDLKRGCIVLQESTKNFKVASNIMETFNILSNSALREAIRKSRETGTRSYPYKPLT